MKFDGKFNDEDVVTGAIKNEIKNIFGQSNMIAQFKKSDTFNDSVKLANSKNKNLKKLGSDI